MMYSIDNIPMTTYGLYLSTQEGTWHAMELKPQFFTIYGKEGYQITKRKANILDIKGFIIASSLADFKTKVSALATVFKASGLRAVQLESEVWNCFATQGFQINRVYAFETGVYAQFTIKLNIVNV